VKCRQAHFDVAGRKTRYKIQRNVSGGDSRFYRKGRSGSIFDASSKLFEEKRLMLLSSFPFRCRFVCSQQGFCTIPGEAEAGIEESIVQQMQRRKPSSRNCGRLRRWKTIERSRANSIGMIKEGEEVYKVSPETLTESAVERNDMIYPLSLNHALRCTLAKGCVRERFRLSGRSYSWAPASTRSSGNRPTAVMSSWGATGKHLARIAPEGQSGFFQLNAVSSG